MKTREFFKKKQVLSFEVFPPKRTAGIETIYTTLDGLKGLHPDFISVTYGAGGSENFGATLEIAASIKRDYGIEGVAHLPCLCLDQQEVSDFLRRCSELGIENLLALRGDRNPSYEPKGVFQHASDLVTFIKSQGDFNVIGACYPEGHSESQNMVEDIQNLKRKVDAGADELITQLFFDNRYFYEFQERCALAGINVPIEAGIMPVVNAKQILRMVSLCGSSLPPKFSKMIQRYEDQPEALRDAGIAYAVDQITDLVTQGVDGIHLYTMNNPYVAQKICQAVASLFQTKEGDHENAL